MTASPDTPLVTSVTCSRCGGVGERCVCAPVAALAGDADLIHRLGEALGPQYVVVRRLAQGGFSDVFEICDIELDRRLAVKVLRPDVAWTHGMRARFKQEARAIARLNHPNTVPIHFVGESDGLVFYVMSYVEGRTLADLLQAQGPLDPLLVAQLVLPVLEALEHAHSLGIVHRDIKPDNVLIESASGRPLLVDFGIAKCLDGVATHTQAGFVVGTPLYMSPEQALGRDTVDARADLYALGAMLFQLLTGAPPFEGKTSAEIVGKHLTQPVPVPVHLNARIPVWLSDVIVRCMAKDPADRFASAGHVMEALRAGLATAPVERITAARIVARIESVPRSPISMHATAPVLPVVEGQAQRGQGRPRNARWLAVAAAIVVVLGATGAFLARGTGTSGVVVANQLLSPVWFAVPGERAVLVQPGDSLQLTWPSEESLAIDWTMVRPVSSAGKPMGDALRGTLDLGQVDGRVRHALELSTAGKGYFAPRITNASGVPLRVAVEANSGERLCDCDVPASGAVVWLGYYPMNDRTAVRVSASGGREAVFDGLASRIDHAGQVALRVEKSDLPWPAPRRSAPRPATRSNSYAAKAPPPVLAEVPEPVAIIEPLPAPEPIVEPVVETPPPPAPRKEQKSSNPVASFLPVR